MAFKFYFRITLRLRRHHHRTSQPNEAKYDDEAPVIFVPSFQYFYNSFICGMAFLCHCYNRTILLLFLESRKLLASYVDGYYVFYLREKKITLLLVIIYQGKVNLYYSYCSVSYCFLSIIYS